MAVDLAINLRAPVTLCLRLATVVLDTSWGPCLLGWELAQHATRNYTWLEFSTVIICPKETVLGKVRATGPRARVTMTTITDHKTGLFIGRKRTRTLAKRGPCLLR